MESPFSPSIYCFPPSHFPPVPSGRIGGNLNLSPKQVGIGIQERKVGLYPAVRTKGPFPSMFTFALKIGKVQVLSANRRRNVSLSFSLSVPSFHSRSNATLPPPPPPPHHYASHQKGRGSQEGLGPTSIDLSQDNLRNFWLLRNSPN